MEVTLCCEECVLCAPKVCAWGRQKGAGVRKAHQKLRWPPERSLPLCGPWRPSSSPRSPYPPHPSRGRSSWLLVASAEVLVASRRPAQQAQALAGHSAAAIAHQQLLAFMGILGGAYKAQQRRTASLTRLRPALHDMAPGPQPRSLGAPRMQARHRSRILGQDHSRHNSRRQAAHVFPLASGPCPWRTWSVRAGAVTSL